MLGAEGQFNVSNEKGFPKEAFLLSGAAQD